MAIQMPNVTSFSGSWIMWFRRAAIAPGKDASEVALPFPCGRWIRSTSPGCRRAHRGQGATGRCDSWDGQSGGDFV